MEHAMDCNEELVHHATPNQQQAIPIAVSEVVSSGPAMEVNIANPTTAAPHPVTPGTKLSKKRYSDGSEISQTYPPSPPTAIHPALRPISVFSRSSSAESSRTLGHAYDSMSTGSRPSTNWTIGTDYNSMKPGILPNSDWTTGLSYEEMRGNSLAGSELSIRKKKGGLLRGYKEELKQNFKAMDRAFSQY